MSWNELLNVALAVAFHGMILASMNNLILAKEVLKNLDFLQVVRLKSRHAQIISTFYKAKSNSLYVQLTKAIYKLAHNSLYHIFSNSSIATLQVFCFESWLDVTWENRTCEVIQMWILIFSCAFNLSFFLVTWCLLFAPLNIRLIRWGSKLYKISYHLHLQNIHYVF